MLAEPLTTMVELAAMLARTLASTTPVTTSEPAPDRFRVPEPLLVMLPTVSTELAALLTFRALRLLSRKIGAVIVCEPAWTDSSPAVLEPGAKVRELPAIV